MSDPRPEVPEAPSEEDETPVRHVPTGAVDPHTGAPNERGYYAEVDDDPA